MRSARKRNRLQFRRPRFSHESAIGLPGTGCSVGKGSEKQAYYSLFGMKHVEKEQNTIGGVGMNNAEITIGQATYEIHRNFTGNKTVIDLVKESLMMEKQPEMTFDTNDDDGV